MKSEAESVAELVTKATRVPIAAEVAGAPLYFIPQGERYEVKEFDPDDVLMQPRRNRGITPLADAASVILMIHQFPKAPTVINYNMRQKIIGAVFNEGTEEAPGWGDHEVTYTAVAHDDLEKWLAASRMAGMTHEQLADFLEDAPGIVDPAKADLLTTVTEFRTVESGEGKSVVDPRTGSYSVKWEGSQKHETEIPKLQVRVFAFRNETPLISLGVRIRPQVKDKKVMFRIIIDDFQSSYDAAFGAILARVTSEDNKYVSGAHSRVFHTV